MNTELYIFGLIGLALAAFAIAATLTPMWRSRNESGHEDTDIEIYRGQLSEVDRDLARGVLNEDEAERTRIEIQRRLLSADAGSRAKTSDAPKGVSRAIAAFLALCLIASAGAGYVYLGAPGYGDVPRAQRIALGEERRANRPSQLEAETANPIEDTLPQFDQQTRDLIQSRRAAAFEQAQDPQVWDVLVQTEAAIGHFQRATRAQERLIALRGDTASNADYERLLDLMVAATQGYVSPEAETVALTVLRNDPDNFIALYYAGLMYAQNDRPDRAFALWRRVVEEGDPDTLQWGFAAGQIEDVAAQFGMAYTLPERRGPSDADIEAAESMDLEDRRAMIQGMVAQLSDRLATEGGPPQDWARLVSSLAVLGEDETARAILGEAELVFGGDVQAVNIVRRAAQEAGLIE